MSIQTKLAALFLHRRTGFFIVYSVVFRGFLRQNKAIPPQDVNLTPQHPTADEKQSYITTTSNCIVLDDQSWHGRLCEENDVPTILHLMACTFHVAITNWTAENAKKLYGGEVRMTTSPHFGLRLPGGAKCLRADQILSFSIPTLSHTFADKTPLLWDLFTHLLDVNSVEPNGNEATQTADPSVDAVPICMNSDSDSDDSAGEWLEYWTGGIKMKSISWRRRLMPVISTLLLAHSQNPTIVCH